jgi:hypothetical protein
MGRYGGFKITGKVNFFAASSHLLEKKNMFQDRKAKFLRVRLDLVYHHFYHPVPKTGDTIH